MRNANPASLTRLAMTGRGVDGNTIISEARAPTIVDGRVGDWWINTATDEGYGPKLPSGWGSPRILRGKIGPNGWSPVDRIAKDGRRRVMQRSDWEGGAGTKPGTGYLGTSGLVPNIANATDLRGLTPMGALDCSTNPAYPAANDGHVYFVRVSGKIGGASGKLVGKGDMLICNVDGSSSGSDGSVGGNWTVINYGLDAILQAIADESIKSGRFFGLDPDADDNSDAFNDILNASAFDGVFCHITGGVYKVAAGIIIPTNTAYGVNPVPWNYGIPSLISLDGNVVVEKTDEEQDDFLIATDRWVADSQYGSGPAYLQSIVFNAKGNAKNCLVNTGYGFWADDCGFRGAFRDEESEEEYDGVGYLEPIKGMGGTLMTGPRVTSRLTDSRIFENDGIGALVDYDPVNQPAVVISDGWLTGNLIYNNKRGNLKLKQAAGYYLHSNEAYHTVAPDIDVNFCTWIGAGIKAANIQGNTWTGYGSQTYALIVDNAAAFMSDLDTMMDGLGVLFLFNAGTGSKYAKLSNPRMLGANAQVVHGRDDASCEIIVENGYSEATTPFAWTGGNTHGLITYKNLRRYADTTIYSGTARQDGKLCVQIEQGIANPSAYGITLTARSLETQIFRATAASDTQVTLPSTPRPGMRFWIIRALTATGYTNLNIKAGATTIASLAAGAKALVEYDGDNSAWIVTGTGTVGF